MRIGEKIVARLGGILLAALVSGLVACRGGAGEDGGQKPDPTAAGGQSEAGEAETPDVPLVVLGEVASVYPEDGFVLIRKFGGGALPSGRALMAVSRAGASVNLIPSGERIGRFHAADFDGAAPGVGDEVVSRRLPDSGVEISPGTGADGSNTRD